MLAFTAANKAAQTATGEGESDQKGACNDQSEVRRVGDKVLDLLEEIFKKLHLFVLLTFEVFVYLFLKLNTTKILVSLVSA